MARVGHNRSDRSVSVRAAARSSAAAGPLRLGLGATVDPTGVLPRGIARKHFFDAVVAVAPGAVEGLRCGPLAEARRWALGWLALKGGGAAEDDLRGWMRSALPAVQGATQAWLRTNHLDVDWCRDLGCYVFSRAFDRVVLAAAGREVNEPIETGLGAWLSGATVDSVAPLPLALLDAPGDAGLDALLAGVDAQWAEVELTLGGRPAPLRFPGVTWNQRTEPRAAARGRILADLERRLDEQLDGIEAAALAAGDHPTPMKRTGDEHFRWLARYQVEGESYSAIARDTGNRRQTVAGAIHETAALIGLPLRDPDPPGRPRRRPSAPRIVRVERSRG